MEITKGDQEWLQNNFFPNQVDFKEDTNGYSIKGTFSFSVFFDQEKMGYLLKPKEKFRKEKNYIEDKYEISVYIPRENNLSNNFYRHIRESGNRIEQAAKKFDLKNEDLHLNTGEKTLCIIGLFQENYDITFQEFIKGAFLQFFYDQSYCERSLYETGKTSWPRGEYSHGLKGILESYFDACQDISEIKKVEITEITLEKIMASVEINVKEVIKKIINTKNLPKLAIYSKFVFGIFILKEAINMFNFDIKKYNL